MGQFPSQKLSMNSSDPIISNPNMSSYSFTDPLEVHSADTPPLENDMNTSHCQYMGYSYPSKEDHIESGYSTPLRNGPLNKKTVYEVVV